MSKLTDTQFDLYMMRSFINYLFQLEVNCSVDKDIYESKLIMLANQWK